MTATDMKIKTAAGKVPMDLIPLSALQGMARVFGYGARKYEEDNWKLAKDKGAIRRYKSAILRHYTGMEGDPMALDEESGLPHIDHLMCSLVMLRGLLNLHHGAKADPGEGKDPPKPLPKPQEQRTFSQYLDELAKNPPTIPGVCMECGMSRCRCKEVRRPRGLYWGF